MSAVAEVQEEVGITPQQYELVRKLVYDRSGINLGPDRQQLVQARLAKRVRVSHLSGFDEFFEILKGDTTGEEMHLLMDSISTNTTYFFREVDHFEFLVQSIKQRIQRETWDRNHHTIRIWCAASSSGEEPYSLAMTLHNLLEQYPTISCKILATDISRKVLAVAKAGRYEKSRAESVLPEFRTKYMKPVADSDPPQVQVIPALQNMITFAQFNLMTPDYPFKHGFDYIFCRNVMIYFDRPTQEVVMSKMTKQLRPEGIFVVGHSESLNSIRHDLTYVKPTIYRK